MKALTDFRTIGRSSYAPSPFSAGLCLIWIGLGLIASHVARMPRRSFYRLQAGLVWQYYGQRNYTNRTARTAWLLAGLHLLIMGLIVLMLKSWRL